MNHEVHIGVVMTESLVYWGAEEGGEVEGSIKSVTNWFIPKL